jgi:hypothetical protein
MKEIKISGSYLRNQTILNLAKAGICIIIFGAVIFALTLRALLTLRVDILEEASLFLSLAPLATFYFYLRKYQIYNGGLKGEKQVTKLLTRKLNNDYYLVNDLPLRNGGGDIDHLVIGPTGVFVLETKNWNGNINCNGDEWKRLGKRNSSLSPSLQVKRNTAKIKHLIHNSSSLGLLNISVEGIVVFTNKHAILHVSNSTVPILKLPQLPNYISTHASSKRYSHEELESVAREVAKERL